MPPDDIFCSAAKMMDPNFRKEVSRQSNSWFEYWISHTYVGTVMQWAVTIWGSYSIMTGMIIFIFRMKTLLCSKRQPQNTGCLSFILTACQYLDSSLNPLHLLKQQMKEKISKLEYKQAMIQSDMEEIMVRHMELLVKVAELEGSMLQVDGLMPPKPP